VFENHFTFHEVAVLAKSGDKQKFSGSFLTRHGQWSTL